MRRCTHTAVKRGISTILLVAVLIGAMLCLWHLKIHPTMVSTPVSPSSATRDAIVLVPLDGRPPCRQFVIDAGQLTGTDVVTPPGELRDYYSQPGDTEGIRPWLMASLAGKKAAILSIDQLLYGGLLAAREKSVTDGQIASLCAYLRELHAAHPDVPLYAFSILPRLTPQDTIDGYQERRDLVAYSRLAGRKAAGQPVDEAELTRLHDAIPPASLERYLAHFEENRHLNEALSGLAQEGTLHLLVLGQDDGERYSIPNIEKEAIRRHLADNGTTTDQVFLTHGADEIALSLLARIQNEQAGHTPRIWIDYDKPASRDRVMPYMAVSNEATAGEKIALMGGRPAASPEDADFTLLIATMDSGQDESDARAATAARISEGLNAGRSIALVDLSKHFTAEETILPQLLRLDAPLLSLTAYAGWNTASNAIGTAAAQASLYTLAHAQSLEGRDSDAAWQAEYTRIRLLTNRFLEDYSYLKDTIETVNTSLKKAGYTNTADLNLEQNYRWANAMLQRTMKENMKAMLETPALRHPFRVCLPDGTQDFRLRSLTMETSYPWPRTFEIYLENTPFLEKVSH